MGARAEVLGRPTARVKVEALGRLVTRVKAEAVWAGTHWRPAEAAWAGTHWRPAVKAKAETLLWPDRWLGNPPGSWPDHRWELVAWELMKGHWQQTTSAGPLTEEQILNLAWDSAGPPTEDRAWDSAVPPTEEQG